MKKLFLIFSFVFAVLTVTAQKPLSGFYYLKQPVSDVFYVSFMEPKGNNDPAEAYNQYSPDFSDKDLMVRNSYSTQTVYYPLGDTVSTVSYNSWSDIKGIEVIGHYWNVRHVVLNDSALLKIDVKDHFYHPVEGLKADSVVFTIKKTANNDESIAAFETITELFAAGPTFISKVLSAMDADSTKDVGGDLTTGAVYLKDSTQDSISFVLKDKNVYYAVRYIKVGDRADLESLFSVEKNPVCKPKVKTADIKYKSKSKGRKLDYNLLGDSDCKSNKIIMMMHFEYDTLYKKGYVYIVYNKDTLYKSKPFYFHSSHNNYCRDSYRFLLNKIEELNGTVRNELIAFNYGFYFDSRTKEITVLNWDKDQKIYTTCIYYQFADVTYYPQ